jgi:hypothetical protein
MGSYLTALQMTTAGGLSPSWFNAECSQYSKDIWKPQTTVRVRIRVRIPRVLYSVSILLLRLVGGQHAYVIARSPHELINNSAMNMLVLSGRLLCQYGSLALWRYWQ